jgi:formate hydrogenlyase transcriptional activator
MGREVPAIPEKVMDALKRWTWPGNIRELQNVIERAVLLSGSSLELPPQDVQPMPPRAVSSAKRATTFHEAERDAILRALRESGGVIAGPTGAAARLGLSRTTLEALEDAAAGYSAAVLLNARRRSRSDFRLATP